MKTWELNMGIFCLTMLSTRVGNAEPSRSALNDMRTAFQNCQRGSEAEIADGEYEDYEKYKASAIKADATIRDHKGDYYGTNFAELWPKCEAWAEKYKAYLDGRPNKESIDLFNQALSPCKRGLTEGQGRPADFLKPLYDEYAEKMKQAIAADARMANYKGVVPSVVSQPINVGQMKAQCEGLRGAVGKAAAADAARDRDREKWIADSNARAKAAEKAEAAKLASMAKKLKGDRKKVFLKEGEPSDYVGKLESAPYWEYRSTYTDRPGTCLMKFTFAGNKLKKKSANQWCR